jgi:hypothetical protein
MGYSAQFLVIFEPNTISNRLIIYNWQHPDWRNFRYDLKADKNTKAIVIAKLIEKAITAGKPKARYSGGYMAKPALFAKKILSDRMFDK